MGAFKETLIALCFGIPAVGGAAVSVAAMPDWRGYALASVIVAAAMWAGVSVVNRMANRKR